MIQNAAVVRKRRMVRLGEGPGSADVLLPEPDMPPDLPFVGQQQLVDRILIAWDEFPAVLVEGPPGVGKSALGHHLAKVGRASGPIPIWIMHATADMDVPDLTITLRISPASEGRLVGSGLVAAAIHGGICLVDDLQCMPPKTSAALLGLLTEERVLSSVLEDHKIIAHPDFRLLAATNPGPGGSSDLLEGLESRLKPKFTMGLPDPGELAAILEARIGSGRDGVKAQLLAAFRSWSAEQPQRITPRAAIQIVSFASALARRRPEPLRGTAADELIELAAAHVVA
jgi:MoxR-like ATPase